MPTLSNNDLTLTITAVDKASAVLRQLSGATKTFGDTSEEASGSTGKLNSSLGKTGVVLGAVSGVVGTVVNRAFSEMGSLIDGAVARVDTLNQFPKVLEAMGVGAADAKAATNTLNKSLQGLPTTLQDGANGVQQFIAAGLSSGRATDTFLAMNNALLAAGGNAQDTGIVMDSLTRALSGGSTQATTIQAALSRMPTALQGLQKETGKSADELYRLYAADPQKLADDLVNLNKKGGGGLASLEAQAREATGGIGTGMENARTAVTRGLAGILQAIGTNNISGAVSGIGSAFEHTLGVIAQTVGFVKSNKAVFLSLAVGIGAITTALIVSSAAMKTYTALTLALSAVQAIQVQGLGFLRAAWLALNIAMNASPLGLAITAIGLLAAGISYLALTTGGATAEEQRANAEKQRSIDLTKKLSDAEDALKGARYDQEGAALRVEQAQKSLNDATAQYGPNSLEARDAAHNLEGAQNDLKAANDRVKDSTNAITDAQKQQIQTVNDVIKKLDDLNGKSVTYYINGQEMVAQKVNGKNYLTPTFASGTNYAPGGLTVVGDNPDGSWNSTTELVDLPRGSKVYSNRQSRQIASQAQSGASVTIGEVHLHGDADIDRLVRAVGMRLAL